MIILAASIFCLSGSVGSHSTPPSLCYTASVVEAEPEEEGEPEDMGYKQLVKPEIPYSVYFGECLRQVRSSFGAPAVHARASQAGAAALYKHHDRDFPTDVSVPVYFTHWGTYSGVTGEFGHVVIHVPGKGFMSSPSQVNAYGVTWYQSIEQIERAVGGKFLYWTEDVNGVRVVEPVKTPPKPAPKPQITLTSIEQEMDDMQAVYYMQGKTYKVAFFNSFSGFWSEYISTSSPYNNQMARTLTGNFGPVTQSHFEALKRDMEKIRTGKK